MAFNPIRFRSDRERFTHLMRVKARVRGQTTALPDFSQMSIEND